MKLVPTLTKVLLRGDFQLKKQIIVKYLYTHHSQKSISRSDEILVVQI